MRNMDHKDVKFRGKDYEFAVLSKFMFKLIIEWKMKQLKRIIHSENEAQEHKCCKR